MSTHSPVCALCLETVEDNDADSIHNSVQSFKQFVHFSRAYLKVTTGGYFAGNHTLPRLCEECADEVKVAVEVHKQVDRLRCQLLWKMMKLGEIISRSQIKAQGFPDGHIVPINSAFPASVTSALLQVFRRQVKRKCALKARNILPSVVLRRKKAIVVEMDELKEWKLVNKPGQTEIQFLVALIILFASVYGWNLSKIIKEFPCDDSNAWFVRVTANSTETTIPTRPTLRAFAIFVVVFSLGNGWNLEEIVQQHSQKSKQSVSKSVKRKPGRPPGSGVKKPCTSMASPSTPKRKPGRPPKSCNSHISSSSLENTQFTMNRKGRSPENCSNGAVVNLGRIARPPKRKRGRPPRVNLENIKYESPESPTELTLHIQDIRTIATPKVVDNEIDADNLPNQEVDASSPDTSMVAIPKLDFAAMDRDDDDAFDDRVDLTYEENSNLDLNNKGSPVPKSEQITDSSTDETMQFQAKRKVKKRMVRKNNGLASLCTDEPNVPPPYSLRLRTKTTYIESSDQESLEVAPDNADDGGDDDWLGNDELLNEDSQLDKECVESLAQKRQRAKELENKTQKGVVIGNEKSFDAYTLQCSECPFTSRVFCSFKTHLKREHCIELKSEETENCRCGTCDEVFDSELNLILHLQQQHEKMNIFEQDRIFCVYCFRSFSNVQLSLLHKKNVHWLRSQNFHCEVDGCRELFLSQQELHAHYKSSHADVNLFSCGMCHWPFLNKHRLHLHQFNHSGYNALGGYECPAVACHKLYHSPMVLASHFNQFHHGGLTGETEAIKCWGCSSSEDCSFSFFSESEFTIHKHLHSNLEKHMLLYRTGEGENRKKWMPDIKICGFCQEPFATAELRKTHENTCPAGPPPEKSKQTNEGALSCVKSYCTTKGRGDLSRLPNRDQKYACEKRLQKIAKLCYLKLHMRKHTRARFRCQYCSQRYVELKSLRYHCKTKHPNELPVTTPSLTQCVENNPSAQQKCKRGKKPRKLPKKRLKAHKINRPDTGNSIKRVFIRTAEPIKNASGSTSTDPPDIDLSQNFTISCTFSECSSIFGTLLPFLEHLQNEHFKTDPVGENAHSCRTCQEHCKSELSLLAHLEKDHERPEEEEASHFCVYCHRSFCTEQLVELHRKNIHWLYPHQLPCEVENCSQEFASTGQLSEHYVTSHSSSDVTNSDPAKREELKLFSCEQCHWPFLSERRLLLHRFNHLKVGEKDYGYQCPICQRRYETVMKLADHFNQAQIPYHCDLKDKLDNWICSDRYCDFSFFSEKESIAHQKLHELYQMQPRNRNISKKTISIGRDPQEFPCVYCLEIFYSQESNKEHEANCPNGPIPEQKLKMKTRYVCGRCGHATNFRGRMRRHSLTHAEKKFQCLECENKFSRPDQLRYHMKSRHSSPEKKLVCHLCGVKRATESDMKYHISEHERKHLCPECGQMFTRAWLLSVHMRKHTGERIRCEWCPTFYRTVPELKEHYQSRHPEEFEKSHGNTSKIRVKYKLVKKDKSTRYRDVPGGSKEAAGESSLVEQQQQNQQSSHNFSYTDILNTNSINEKGDEGGQQTIPTELNLVASIF